MHLFVGNSDHDFCFELLVIEDGLPNRFLAVLLHTMAVSGLSRVRIEFVLRLIVLP
jgi:hypothetical protein